MIVMQMKVVMQMSRVWPMLVGRGFDCAVESGLMSHRHSLRVAAQSRRDAEGSQGGIPRDPEESPRVPKNLEGSQGRRSHFFFAMNRRFLVQN